MKNIEKYRDAIVNCDGNVCDDFIKSIILASFNKQCSEISADNSVDCMKCSLLTHVWLNDEYDETADIWQNVKVDTPILVSRDGNRWEPKYFAKYEDGKVYAFRGGMTSFTGDKTIAWAYAKLAEVENE